MRAAEKYAELEAAGLERPRCECHGEPQKWDCNPDRPGDGRWRCRVKANAETAGHPFHDPNSNNYPDRVFYGGGWRTQEQIERWRERQVERDSRYRSDPEFRRLQTIYQMFYYQRQKRERYVGLGLVNEGLSRGNNGQEDHSRRDRAA